MSLAYFCHYLVICSNFMLAGDHKISEHELLFAQHSGDRFEFFRGWAALFIHLRHSETRAGTGRSRLLTGSQFLSALGRITGSRAFLLLLLLFFATVHAGDRPHSWNLRHAALRDGFHHLRRLLETRDQLIHVGDGHA